MNKLTSYSLVAIGAIVLGSALIQEDDNEPEKVRTRVITATNILLADKGLSLPKNTECIIANGTVPAIEGNEMEIVVEILCKNSSEYTTLHPIEKPKDEYLIIIDGVKTDENGLLKQNEGELFIPAYIDRGKKKGLDA